jgi:hypothetical protein
LTIKFEGGQVIHITVPIPVIKFRNTVEQQQGVLVSLRIRHRVVHERGRYPLIASVGTGVDSADAAGGKPSGSHAEQAFIDPVATKVFTVAIRAAYLLWAIAGKGNESA